MMPDTVAHLATLETRVSGLEKGVGDIVSSINTLSRKLDEKSQTQWPVIWSAAGVCISILIGIGSLAYWPVVNRMDKIEEAIVPRREHERQWAQTDKYLERLADRVYRLEQAK